MRPPLAPVAYAWCMRIAHQWPELASCYQKRPDALMPNTTIANRMTITAGGVFLDCGGHGLPDHETELYDACRCGAKVRMTSHSFRRDDGTECERVLTCSAALVDLWHENAGLRTGHNGACDDPSCDTTAAAIIDVDGRGFHEAFCPAHVSDEALVIVDAR